VNKELVALAKQHHLSAFVTGKLKISDGLTNEEYLLELLKGEAKVRDERLLKERIKSAHLPTFKGFDEFDVDFQKGITKKQLDTLANLEWIDEVFNLILIGPPGTGKTHLALAVGNKAVREGYNVSFATMDKQRAKLVMYIYSKLQRFRRNRQIVSGSSRKAIY